MRWRSWGVLAVAACGVIVGCESEGFYAPPIARVAAGVFAASASDEAGRFLPCPNGAVCYTPDSVAPVTPSFISLQAFSQNGTRGNCGQEACDTTSVFDAIIQDSSGGYDLARYNCGGSFLAGMYSWATCWECTGECADSAHLASIAALPEHQGWNVFSVVMKDGPTGSDCQIRRCPSGYSLLAANDTSRATTCVTYLPAAAAPSGSVHSGKPRISWGSVEYSTSEYVERRFSHVNESWESLGGPHDSSYSDSTINVSGAAQSSPPSSGAWVAYRVRSSNLAGSTYSQVVYFTTSGTAPSTPSLTAAVRRGTLVTINWGSSTGALVIEVERQFHFETEWEQVWQSFSSSSGTYQPGAPTITGTPQSSPPSGDWVRYRVRALNHYGASSYSAVAYYLLDEGGA
jgi:hypothetical protein